MLSPQSGGDVVVLSSADPIEWFGVGRSDDVAVDAFGMANVLVDSLPTDRDAGLEAVDLETVDDSDAGFFPESSGTVEDFPFIIASIRES